MISNSNSKDFEKFDDSEDEDSITENGNINLT